MSAEIHPTAVIDPQAEIGNGVTIGPYCVIHAGVVLGDDCWLQNHVTLAGPTIIGKRNRFFAYGSIGQQTQDLKYKGEPTYCEIGDDNTFREFVTVNRSTDASDKTLIGSHNNFLTYSHIAHDVKVGNHVIFSNNGTVGGHCIIEDHVIMGGLSGIHQFCRMGKFAMSGGCTKIVQDVPPFMIADGSPAAVRVINKIGMERNGYSAKAIQTAKDAHRLLYRSKLNVDQALQEIDALPDTDGVLATITQFVRASERGIVR